MKRIVFLVTPVAILLGLACGTTGPVVPPGTPDCRTICEIAWPCGGVIENDLDGCIASCDDNRHELYRACIYTHTCEELPDCKLYAPEPD